jgi:hypothetical protein
MKIESSVVFALATAFAVLVSGCDSDVTARESGLYQGQNDPEASQEAAARRADALADRAKVVFTDR